MGRILEKGKVRMKTKDFLKKHDACTGGAKWALSIGDDMADVWNAMIEQGKHAWLIWTATRPGVFPDTVLRKLACRFVRETPLADGRKVWDLLTDERSRKAVEVAEAYADGKATYEELDAARTAAAYTAADAAYAAVHAAAYVAYAARAAARDAADAAYAADAADAAYAACAAAYAAACAAARAARAAARDAVDVAKVAQVRMIAELGNPFKERVGK
jgi:hypothetical protein